MKRAMLIPVSLAVLAVGAGSCGSDEDANNATSSAASAKSETDAMKKTASADSMSHAKRGRTVKVLATKSYGKILTDGKGRTLYLFTREHGKNRSRCYGACAVAWPPYLTPGEPRAGKGANADELGTTGRRNGKMQVTYNGHPLYYYEGEDEAGEILCQGVDEFGGTWYVVAPGGSAITKTG